MWRPAAAARRGEAEVGCPVTVLVHALRSVLITIQECCGSCAGGVLLMAGLGSKRFGRGWREACRGHDVHMWG